MGEGDCFLVPPSCDLSGFPFWSRVADFVSEAGTLSFLLWCWCCDCLCWAFGDAKFGSGGPTSIGKIHNRTPSIHFNNISGLGLCIQQLWLALLDSGQLKCVALLYSGRNKYIHVAMLDLGQPTCIDLLDSGWPKCIDLLDSGCPEFAWLTWT